MVKACFLQIALYQHEQLFQAWLNHRRERLAFDAARGAVADPFLACRIRAGGLDEPDADERAAEWQALRPLIGEFVQGVQRKVEARHAPGRIKQWVQMLARRHEAARALFACIRPLRSLPEVAAELQRHGIHAPQPGDAPAGDPWQRIEHPPLALKAMARAA